jgi:hypothetical protein
MYRKVLNVCEEYKQEYANIPAFNNSVEELKARIREIQSVTEQQTATVSAGATKDKNSAVDGLAEQSLKVANALYVYAYDNKDYRLMDKVNVNKSSFYHNHSETSLTLAKIIATEADNHSEDIRGYGISDADRAELDSVIAKFEEVINAPSEVIGERKLYTGNLKELFAAADSTVYDKLDKLIRLFKLSSPEFFTLYSNARNVINTAARKKKDNSTKDERIVNNE